MGWTVKENLVVTKSPFGMSISVHPEQPRFRWLRLRMGGTALELEVCQRDEGDLQIERGNKTKWLSQKKWKGN
jgi:hypothetical protein